MKAPRLLTHSIAAFLFAPTLFAVTDTWDGNLPNAGAGDSNISTGLNWADDTAPVSDLVNTDLIFAGTTKLAPNFTAAFSTDSIAFINTAGAFVLGGSAITIGTAGISNTDAQTQTINNSVTLGTATSSFQAISGSLSFGGTLALGANALAVSGVQATFFNGAITGTGAITKTGTGLMQIAPTATAIGADFNINGGTLLLSPTGITQVFSGTSTVAIGAAGTMTLNESMTFDGGAQFTRANGGTVNIGAGETLRFQSGSDAVITGAFTQATTSTIVVTGAGSTFTTSGNATFGTGATLNVLAGGSFSNGANTINIGTSGNGAVTVDGAGSSFSGGTVFLGAAGASGSLTFSNGSTGSFGIINVDDSGSAATDGTLLIQSGSTVTGTGLDLGIQAVLNIGTVTIDGASSALTITGAGTTDIGAASTSAANFNVQSGGVFNSGTGLTTVNATGTIAIAGGTFNANGDMLLDGGQMTKNASGIFNLAAGRTLTVQGGGDFTITGGFINATASNYAITGAGSTLAGSSALSFNGGSDVSVLAGGSLSAVGVLNVGTAGTGTMTVDGGGSIASSSSLILGSSAGATGTVTLSGGSTGAFGGIVVGSGGTLNIQSGATATGSSLSVANSGAVSPGIVTVTGAGSVLTLIGTASAGIGAASGSTAALNVQSSGIFTSGTGATTVNATGTVNVTGGTYNSQGNLTLNGGDLNVAAASTFTLGSGRAFNVQAGGVATFNNSGGFAASSNSITVTGAGSQLVGGGTGFLISGGSNYSIINGGALSTGQFIDVGTLPGGLNVLFVDGVGSSVTASTPSFWGGGGGTGAVEFSNNATGNVGAIALPSTVGTGSLGTLLISSGADVTMGNFNIASASNAITGAATITGPGSTLTLNGASAFTLGGAGASTATLTVNSGGAFTSGTGAVVLDATGTVNIGGGTVTLLGPLFYNFATINFTSGALSIVSDWSVGSSGLLGPNVTFDAARRMTTTQTTTIDAFQTLTLNGGTLTTGALANNGALDFQKGTLAITGAGGLTIGGGGALGANVTLGIGANLLVTNAATVATGASLTLNGGVFTAGALNITGTLRATLGIASAASGTNSSGGRIFIADALDVSGTLTNAAGARITLQDGTGLLSGAGALNNSGLVTGDGTIAKPLNNAATGEVRGEPGRTLNFTAAATNSGAFNLLGGTLDFAGAVTNSAGAFISGHGALFTGGLTNDGQMAFSGGTTDIRGDTTLTAGARVATSGAGSTTAFFDDVVHNGLEIFTGAGASTVFYGAQSGAGSFTGTGTVYFIGDLRPGNSPASVLYEGDLVFGGASSLTLEIGGLVSGAEYDHLDIGGTLHADGDLALALLAGYEPQFGDTFDLLDVGTFAGDFDTISAPALGGGNEWDFSALKTTGTVTVVPEPGVGALLLSALTLLGARRARVRQVRVPISPLRTP